MDDAPVRDIGSGTFTKSTGVKVPRYKSTQLWTTFISHVQDAEKVQTASLVNQKIAQLANVSDKRAPIIELRRAGKNNSEILKLLRSPKSTVYHTINRFKELNSTEDRPRSGRPQTSRNPKVINAVRASLRRNPKRLMRKMARETDVRENPMRNIVKIDLKVSPIKLQTCHPLTNL